MILRFLWTGMICLWIIFSLPVSAAASENNLDEDIADLEQELLAELDLDEADQVLEENEGTQNLSFTEILNRILESDGQRNFSGIWRPLLFRICRSAELCLFRS